MKLCLCLKLVNLLKLLLALETYLDQILPGSLSAVYTRTEHMHCDNSDARTTQTQAGLVCWSDNRGRLHKRVNKISLWRRDASRGRVWTSICKVHDRGCGGPRSCSVVRVRGDTTASVECNPLCRLARTPLPPLQHRAPPSPSILRFCSWARCNQNRLFSRAATDFFTANEFVHFTLSFASAPRSHHNRYSVSSLDFINAR